MDRFPIFDFMAPASNFILLLIISFVIGCNASEKNQQIIAIAEKTKDESSLEKQFPLFTKDTTLTIQFNGKHSISTTLRFPDTANFKGTIMTLPGWNFSRNLWCDSTEFCQKALEQGYVIVQPEMGKSIYCDTLYPETRVDWKKYPTRKWIKDSLIPLLQMQNILLSDHYNFVLGLSTGARGAALIAMDLPSLFSGCAVLSGDYDQTNYPMDNLYRGYYGNFNDFPERWFQEDNLITQIKKVNIPLYIGHGSKDQIVPIHHSKRLKEALDACGNTSYKFHIDSLATHNYAYWNSEVGPVLRFFSALTSSLPTSD